PGASTTTSRPAGAKSRWYHAALPVCGAALCCYLIFDIGATPILESFRVLSWRLLIVVVFPCVALKTLDTLAWGVTFPLHERMSFRPLATALLAGQATANTPGGMVGGDAIMAWMLRDQVSFGETFSSLIITHTT